MGLGDNLDIGMLSNNQDGTEDIVLESLSKDLDKFVPEGKKDEVKNEPVVETVQPGDKDNQGTASEGKKSPESVASEEGKGGAPTADSSSPTGNDKLPGIISSLATHFHEKGVLPSLNLEEKKINSIEDLQEAINAEIKNGLEENVRMYKEAMEKGVPQDAYTDYERQKQILESIEPGRLENNNEAELRFGIIAQDFINRGYSQDEARKFAKRSVDLGEDVADSKNALGRLKEHNEKSYNEYIEKAAKEEQDSIDKVKSFVNNSEEFMKGVKLTKAVKDGLIKQMTTPVERDENGKLVSAYGKALKEDPLKVRTMTEYLFFITDGFKDFSKMTNVIESKTGRDIEEMLRNSGEGFLSQGGKAPVNDQSKFTLGDYEIDV